MENHKAYVNEETLNIKYLWNIFPEKTSPMCVAESEFLSLGFCTTA